VLLCLAPALLSAQTDPGITHDEIRKLRDDILAAIQRGDVDAVLPHLHPNVVFTPMNNEVARGPEGVKAYFQKMMTGPDRRVAEMRLNMEVDRLTDLYGNTGIASGSSNDFYKLTSGPSFEVPTRWTCSLVRENGRWLITSFHSSVNAFDNPILARQKRAMALPMAGLGIVAGLAFGLLMGFLLWRRKKA
jgi:ketosteroid isomerase-like protein